MNEKKNQKNKTTSQTLISKCNFVFRYDGCDGFKVKETSIQIESALSFCVQENYLFTGTFKVEFTRASAELR